MYLATKWDSFDNTEDNSFDKDIPDVDSKKIVQHHFKLKKNMCGQYMSFVWRIWEKETFDVVMINVRPVLTLPTNCIMFVLF